MFKPKMTNSLVVSFLRSVRLMSNSNRTPMMCAKNPFVKENLPDLPVMECIRHKTLNIDSHLSSRNVKYGDYEFIECKEGYILIYINTFLRKKEPEDVFYGVYYGVKSPLNINGPVNGVQSLKHANLTAVLRAIETFPNIEAKKLCFCINLTATFAMFNRLQECSENGYRSTMHDYVLNTKNTLEAINKAFRLRNDLQLRFLYTPANVVFTMKEALKLAIQASRV